VIPDRGRGYFSATPPTSLNRFVAPKPQSYELQRIFRNDGATRSSTHWPSRGHELRLKGKWKMDDFNSETDSDYTSYWRDWVSLFYAFIMCAGVSKIGSDGSR
jgi:hypothetical protein